MRMVIFMVLIAILLAACDTGSQSASTQQPEASSEAGSGSGGPGFVLVTVTPFDPDELPIAPPGTLVSSATEDVDAGLLFDSVRLVRFGGPEGAERIEVEVFQDGRYIWNGTPGLVTAETVTQIDNAIDTLNFFGMQGAMLGPSAETADYRYTITVKRGSSERTINAQDGFYPRELNILLAAILDIGFRR